MKYIAILAPFDPYEVKDYLYDDYKSKVYHVNNAATSVNTLVREFLRQNYKIMVFTSAPQDGKFIYLEGENIKVYCYKGNKYKRPRQLFVAQNIRKQIQKEIDSISIIHAHWTYLYALAASYFVNQKPVFCSVRDWAPYIWNKLSGIRTHIYWITNMYIFQKIMNNRHIHFIANSPYTQKRIKAKIGKDVPIIPNPINSDFIIEKQSTYPTNFTFISIAQGIDRWKNFDVLMSAFQRYREKDKNARLVLIGGDFVAENANVQRWKKNNLLVNVDLKGYVNHNELIQLFDNASALVHPSLEESFGNVFLEAMARQIPVIGGVNSGAVPYVLDNGKIGCLCDVSNVDDLLKAMCKVAESSSYRETLIKAASQKIKDTYIDTAVVYAHIKLYKSVIKCYEHISE